MKPLKDTKLGQFLKGSFPKILDTVGDALPDNGVLGIVKHLISKEPDLTPAQVGEALAKVQEYEKEIFAMEIQDRNSARDLQKTALQQEDVFSKRYIYYLSSFVIMSATALGVMLFFVPFPESNRRLIEMFADIYLFAGAIMVLQFFFGSSKGSHDKDETIKNMKP